MTDKAKPPQPMAFKNLAELKRYIKIGTEFKATSHKYHPDIVGLTRVVTKVQTNGFYSKIKDEPNHRFSDCNGGKGFFTEVGKAGGYIFDGTAVKVLDKRGENGVIYELEFYRENTEVNSMNEYDRLYRQAQRYKEQYPEGTRILLLHMGDDPRPVEDDMRGTVKYVDDMSTVHCRFDNGRQLGIIPGEDSFRKLTDEELARGTGRQRGHGRGQRPRHGNVGGCLLEHDILIPQPQADMLLREAAEREASAEELLAEIIRKYIERNERNGG